MKHIKIKGARQNNLKNCNVHIPLGHLTVVCGLSGSGKSSLAFETLFAEGQRHYTQTLSHYSRQYIQEMPKPLVQSVEHIPPALALQQKNTVRSSRPTVATLTELDHFLRLLFTHSAQAFCPKHNTPLTSFSSHQGAKAVQKYFPKGRGLISFPLVPSQSSFTFADLKKNLIKEGFNRIWFTNKKTQSGFPTLHDLSALSKNQKEFYVVLDRLMFKDQARLKDSLKLGYKLFLKYHKSERAGKVVVSGPENQALFLSSAPACLKCAYQFPFNPFPIGLFNFNSSVGACPACKGFGHNMILDEEKVIPNPDKSIMEGAIVPFTMPSTQAELRQLKQFCRRQLIDPHCPWNNLPSLHKEKIWNGADGFIGIKGFFDYLEGKKYKVHVRIFLSRYKMAVPCEECKGGRFRKELSYIYWQNKTIMDFLSMNINTLRQIFQSQTTKTQKKHKDIVQKINTHFKWST